jgi:hypothetical protein
MSTANSGILRTGIFYNLKKPDSEDLGFEIHPESDIAKCNLQENTMPAQSSNPLLLLHTWYKALPN